MLKINLITENLLFEITYFDSLKNKEQTIRLTGINEAKVKENFISSYDQKRYPFKSIRAI